MKPFPFQPTAADLPGLADVLDLAAFERPTWDARRAAIPTHHPRNDGGEGGGQGGEGGGTGGGAPAGGGDTGRTFSQADVDRIVQDRLARDRRQVTETYGDLEQLKADAARAKEREDADKSELERATARVAELETALAASKDETKAANGQLQDLRVDAAIRGAFPEGVVSPDDALHLFTQHHREQVTVGDDGQVTVPEDVVKTFFEGKPFLVGAPSTPAPGPSRSGGAQRQSTVAPDQIPAGTARLAHAYSQNT